MLRVLGNNGLTYVSTQKCKRTPCTLLVKNQNEQKFISQTKQNQNRESNLKVLQAAAANGTLTTEMKTEAGFGNF